MCSCCASGRCRAAVGQPSGPAVPPPYAAVRVCCPAAVCNRQAHSLPPPSTPASAGCFPAAMSRRRPGRRQCLRPRLQPAALRPSLSAPASALRRPAARASSLRADPVSPHKRMPLDPATASARFPAVRLPAAPFVDVRMQVAKIAWKPQRHQSRRVCRPHHRRGQLRSASTLPGSDDRIWRHC